MENKLLVKYCTDCHFASIHLNGYVESRLFSHKKRIYLKCNIQNLAVEYSSEGKYKCFETCPLKEKSLTVSLKF